MRFPMKPEVEVEKEDDRIHGFVSGINVSPVNNTVTVPTTLGRAKIIGYNYTGLYDIIGDVDSKVGYEMNYNNYNPRPNFIKSVSDTEVVLEGVGNYTYKCYYWY